MGACSPCSFPPATIISHYNLTLCILCIVLTINSVVKHGHGRNRNSFRKAGKKEEFLSSFY